MLYKGVAPLEKTQQSHSGKPISGRQWRQRRVLVVQPEEWLKAKCNTYLKHLMSCVRKYAHLMQCCLDSVVSAKYLWFINNLCIKRSIRSHGSYTSSCFCWKIVFNCVSLTEWRSKQTKNKLHNMPKHSKTIGCDGVGHRRQMA